MFHILYLLSTLLLPAPTKVTCTCVPIIDNDSNIIKPDYDLIFKGKVEKIDTIFYVHEVLLKMNHATRDSGVYFTNIIVSLKVDNVFKGDKTSKNIRITTGMGGGDCGFDFNTGKTYVVYAKKKPYIIIDSFKDEHKIFFTSHDESLFETNVCTGTTDQVIKEEAILKKQFSKN